MKPDTVLIERQLIDLKTSISKNSVVRDIKILNPKLSYKSDERFITVKELCRQIIEKLDAGLIGEDNNCKALLNCISDIDEFFNIQQERSAEYWRLTAESFKALHSYINELETENEALEIKSKENEEAKMHADEVDKKLAGIKSLNEEYNKEYEKLVEEIKEDGDYSKIVKEFKESVIRLHNKINRKALLDVSFVKKEEKPIEKPVEEKKEEKQKYPWQSKKQ